MSTTKTLSDLPVIYEYSHRTPDTKPISSDLFQLSIVSEELTGFNSAKISYSEIKDDILLGVEYSTNSLSGSIRIATDSEANSGILENVAINPKQLQDEIHYATDTLCGMVEFATNDEASGGVEQQRVINPEQLMYNIGVLETDLGITISSNYLETTANTSDISINYDAITANDVDIQSNTDYINGISTATTSETGVVMIALNSDVRDNNDNEVVTTDNIKWGHDSSEPRFDSPDGHISLPHWLGDTLDTKPLTVNWGSDTIATTGTVITFDQPYNGTVYQVITTPESIDPTVTSTCNSKTITGVTLYASTDDTIVSYMVIGV